MLPGHLTFYQAILSLLPLLWRSWHHVAFCFGHFTRHLGGCLSMSVGGWHIHVRKSTIILNYRVLTSWQGKAKSPRTQLWGMGVLMRLLHLACEEMPAGGLLPGSGFEHHHHPWCWKALRKAAQNRPGFVAEGSPRKHLINSGTY